MSEDHNRHVVFTQKHELVRRNECQIEEGHLMPDHVGVAALWWILVGSGKDRERQYENPAGQGGASYLMEICR